MPLKNGYSAATVSANIAMLRREGRSAAQSAAIALKKGRESWRKKHAAGPYPHHLKTAKKKAARKARKTVRKNPAQGMQPLYVAYVKDQDGKKFYYAGINTSRGSVNLNDELKYAVLFQRRAPAIETVKYNIKSVYGAAAMRTIGEVYTEIYSPKPKGGRGRNPVPLSKHAKIGKAVELFENFTGHTPKYVDRIDIPAHDVALKIGQCDGVLYTTVRDGRRESYIHKFNKSARPLLCTTFDGRQLLLIGGSFEFTETGINDAG